MTENASPLKPPLPSEVAEHWAQSLHSAVELIEISRLCREGIAHAVLGPRMLEATAWLTGKPTDPRKEDSAKKSAARATAESESDFPVINSMLVISYWSWIEHFVKHTAALWIAHDANVLSAPQFRKVRVLVCDMAELTPVELAYRAIETFEQELPSNQKHGVDRFEQLLTPLKLGGNVDDGLRKAILELHQVRNVIVHRYGLADRRLISACPWLTLAVGERLRVSTQQAEAYVHAITQYGLEVTDRMRAQYTADAEKKSNPTPRVKRLARQDRVTRKRPWRPHGGPRRHPR